MFKQNEAKVDRIIRVIAGLVLLGVGLWPLGGLEATTWGIVASVVGLILLVTGFTGFCLLYSIFGICTLKTE